MTPEGPSTTEQVFSPQQYPLRDFSAERRMEICDVLKSFRDEDVVLFAADVSGRMQRVGKLLKKNEVIEDVGHFERGLVSWMKDKQHGVKHSFSVYEKAKQIRDAEEFGVSDEELLIRAVLHDMGEFIPWYDKSTGELVDLSSKPSIQSRFHPNIMARMIRVAGEKLDVGDVEELAKDIRYHDLYYSHLDRKRSMQVSKELSQAGKCLWDADHLSEIPIDMIARNRLGSLGKWYFLRPDLDKDDRLQWKKRTGGLFDGLSALAREFLPIDHWYMTETGRGLARERSQTFLEDLSDFYGEQYEEGWRLLETESDLAFGTREKGDSGRYVFVSVDEEDLPEGFAEMSLREKLKAIVTTPISNKTKAGREYFGYSLLIGGEDGQWLDPSILLYKDAESLKKSVLKATSAYQRELMRSMDE